MKTRAVCLFLLAAFSGAAVSAAQAAGPQRGEWDFEVTLDGKPIGEHRFALASTDAGERKLTSEAQFAVKLLGLTVYRYKHSATERWDGDCLRQLAARTDDDGTRSQVSAERKGNALDVATSKGSQALDGCVMTFAYWNPAIRSQAQLLNAQTGQVEAVQVSRAGSGSVDVRGQSVQATRWRIDNPVQPIDVWYTAQGEWVGLDSTVKGDRKLSYRLK